MTTTTYHENNGSTGRTILIILMAAILAGAIGQILLSTHAVQRHGTEAEQIRRCLESKGYTQKWQSDIDPDVYIFCTQMDSCTFGIMIAQKWHSLVDGVTFRERTSFSPGDGSACSVDKYLSKWAHKIE